MSSERPSKTSLLNFWGWKIKIKHAVTSNKVKRSIQKFMLKVKAKFKKLKIKVKVLSKHLHAQRKHIDRIIKQNVNSTPIKFSGRKYSGDPKT